MAKYRVGYFVGSLAKASINRQLAKALIRLAPPELEFTEIPIKDLPLYSYDYDADFPPVARAFKQAIADVDAVLFVTPEYNRSIPASPGAIGTALAQQALRGVLGFCNSPQMNSIEAYIQFKPGVITEEGDVTDEKTAEFLRNYITEFRDFIQRVLTVLPRKG